MNTTDYVILLCYLAGIFAVGILFAGRNRSSRDMFAAGGQSPWWISGLSAYMTMFSAGTFVVWGGIAYRWGIVAIMINLCYGVAAILAGYFVAGRWKRLGVNTPAEYVRMRFGVTALHFYTWAMMVYRIVGVAVALYALGVILVAMMPLAEGNIFRDAQTGNLALHWAILLFGGVVVIYTMIGGLWAVLMTDVLQFIVLNLAVLFVIPLMVMKVGGFGDFVAAAPQGFFMPTTSEYTWLFLMGWLAIHFFMIGAEWAFVQRFICVRSPKDARKSTYLFGVLYLISPILWLLPPLLWRVAHPIPSGATPEQITAMAEQAYIQSCRAVLPAGMVGLLVAAMFSATASMASSQLNVFAGVLTNDIYAPLTGNRTSPHGLVWVGRVFTVLLGALLLSIALAVPVLGGAERVIIAVTSLLVVPLLAPMLWGLFSSKLDGTAVWWTAAICGGTGILVKFGLSTDGWFSADGWFSGIGVAQPLIVQLDPVIAWLDQAGRNVDVFLGVILPVLVILAVQTTRSRTAIGWQRIEKHEAAEMMQHAQPIKPNRLPAMIVGWALIACGIMMVPLVFINEDSRWVLTAFAAILLMLGSIILWLTCRLIRHAVE